MRYALYALVVLICANVGGQDVRARPQFDVASIKPVSEDRSDDLAIDKVLRNAIRNAVQTGEVPTIAPNRVQFRNWTLRDLIATAYSVRASQVSGPTWLSDKSFDIEAIAPDGTLKQELNTMLQSLLEDRFALKVHCITQTKRGYALIVGKGGSRLTTAEPSAEPSSTLNTNDQIMRRLSVTKKRIEKTLDDNKSPQNVTVLNWTSITLEDLAQKLEQFTDAPVVDNTGLTGKYSVEIQASNNPDSLGNTIFSAIEDLGLKLVPHNVPTNVLVVDQVSKTPSPN